MTRWLAAWFLYWLGHGLSRIMYDPLAVWLYPLYNNLMIWSSDIQKGDDGPWGSCERSVN